MMTVDEAIAIAENALNYQRLNKIQELVFRESWSGQSYMDIAKRWGYESDYVKDAGARLWKRLSNAFGEKVTKTNLHSVLKRYLRRSQVNVQRNVTIEVNLSGANLSGANLTGSRLIANLTEADSSQADSKPVIMPDDNTESDEEANNREIPSTAKIAEALERAGVLFSPNARMRVTTLEGRQNQEFDFLIFYQGKSGILQIDGEGWHKDAAGDSQRDNCLTASGIRIVSHYSANRCSEEPNRVVQEFLEILSQA